MPMGGPLAYRETNAMRFLVENLTQPGERPLTLEDFA